jgi:hypothetical protein
VTSRDGGRDIDLRKMALEGMKLYGPLVTVKDRVASFKPESKQTLDGADAVFRSINRTCVLGFARSRDVLLFDVGVDRSTPAVSRCTIAA